MDEQENPYRISRSEYETPNQEGIVTVKTHRANGSEGPILLFPEKSPEIAPHGNPSTTMLLFHEPEKAHPERFVRDRREMTNDLGYLFAREGFTVALTDGEVGDERLTDRAHGLDILAWPRDWMFNIPIVNSKHVLVKPDFDGFPSQEFATKQLESLGLNPAEFTFVESALGENGVCSYMGNVIFVREDLIDDKGVKLLEEEYGFHAIPFPHIENCTKGFVTESENQYPKEIAELNIRRGGGHIDLEGMPVARLETDGKISYHLFVNESTKNVFPKQIEEILERLTLINKINGCTQPESQIAVVPIEEETWLSVNSVVTPAGKLVVPALRVDKSIAISNLANIIGRENIIPFPHRGIGYFSSALGHGSARCRSCPMNVSREDFLAAIVRN